MPSTQPHERRPRGASRTSVRSFDPRQDGPPFFPATISSHWESRPGPGWNRSWRKSGKPRLPARFRTETGQRDWLFCYAREGVRLRFLTDVENREETRAGAPAERDRGRNRSGREGEASRSLRTSKNWKVADRQQGASASRENRTFTADSFHYTAGKMLPAGLPPPPVTVVY